MTSFPNLDDDLMDLAVSGCGENDYFTNEVNRQQMCVRSHSNSSIVEDDNLSVSQSENESVHSRNSDMFDNTVLPAKPFCSCVDSSASGSLLQWIHCECGEDANSVMEWGWQDPEDTVGDVLISNEHREICFHPNFSRGTAAVRGSKLLTEGIHYWEVKMVSPVYGTDMMIGIGTEDANLTSWTEHFISLLGEDTDCNTYGLSYLGNTRSGGVSKPYCRQFGQGSIVGCLLDLWHGSLTYYLNRRHLGVAFTQLNSKRGYYPLVASTAARSGMKLIRAESAQINLQTLSCRALRQHIPLSSAVTDAINFPPGLQKFILNNVAVFYRAAQGISANTTSEQKDVKIKRRRQHQSSSSTSSTPNKWRRTGDILKDFSIVPVLTLRRPDGSL